MPLVLQRKTHLKKFECLVLLNLCILSSLSTSSRVDSTWDMPQVIPAVKAAIAAKIEKKIRETVDCWGTNTWESSHAKLGKKVSLSMSPDDYLRKNLADFHCFMKTKKISKIVHLCLLPLSIFPVYSRGSSPLDSALIPPFLA